MNQKLKIQIDNMSLGYMKKFLEFCLDEGNPEWKDPELRQYFFSKIKEKEMMEND